jgi:ribonuclease BN (tRNA processing enzyme)
MLVLYHLLLWCASEETLLREVREKYDGEVVLGNSFDRY